MLSMCTRFTSLPKTLAFITTDAEELLPPEGNVISLLSEAFSVARISLGLLDRLESSPWLGPQYGENLSLPFCPRLLSQEDFLDHSKFSLRSLGVPLVATSLASIQRYAALRVDPKSVKYRQCICLQILIVENATCFLTVPPYAGGIFEGVFCLGSYKTSCRSLTMTTSMASLYEGQRGSERLTTFVPSQVRRQGRGEVYSPVFSFNLRGPNTFGVPSSPASFPVLCFLKFDNSFSLPTGHRRPCPKG
ncbi:hypothetical protein Tco_0321550 [Tanacetum coccineum]